MMLIPSLTLGVSAEEDVEVNIEISKQSIEIDEKIEMTIRIIGTHAGIERPRIPKVKGFYTYYLGRDSQIREVQGVQKTVTEFSFSLVPLSAGKYVIPPVEVEIGDSIYRTGSQPIEVLGKDGVTINPNALTPASKPATTQTSLRSAAPQPGVVQRPQSVPFIPSAAEGSDIFMKAWLDRREVFVGEQVSLTYSIYYRTDTKLEGFEEEPVTTGFWTEEIPLGPQPDKKFIKVAGLKYLTTNFRQLANCLG